MSLKNAIYPIDLSREFSSTMPNSIRNSGIFERHIIVEKLDPTPTVSRKNSFTDIKIEESHIKKQAAQLFS